MTTKTITGLYDTYDAAAKTVREIEAIGVPHDDLTRLIHGGGGFEVAGVA